MLTKGRVIDMLHQPMDYELTWNIDGNAHEFRLNGILIARILSRSHPSATSRCRRMKYISFGIVAFGVLAFIIGSMLIDLVNECLFRQFKPTKSMQHKELR
jgi:hypothetical protein